MINKLTMVGGNIYEAWIKLLKLINIAEERRCSITLQRGKNLKREMLFSCLIVQQMLYVCYVVVHLATKLVNKCEKRDGIEE